MLMPASHFPDLGRAVLRRALFLKPAPSPRTYGVILTHSGEAGLLKLHYQLRVAHTGPAGDGFHRYSLHKETVYCNSAAADDLAGELAARCGAVMYPVAVVATPAGALAAVADDGTERIRRWDALKPQLKEYYTGGAGSIIQAMDRAIRQPAEVLGGLNRDWGIALLFAPVYGLYEGGCREVAASFPCVPYAAPTDFNLTLRMTEDAAHGWVDVAAAGVPVGDLVSGSGAHAGSATTVRRLTLRYRLETSDFSIRSVTCTWEVGGEAAETLEIEMYHLEARRPGAVSVDEKPAQPAVAGELPKNNWSVFD